MFVHKAAQQESWWIFAATRSRPRQRRERKGWASGWEDFMP